MAPKTDYIKVAGCLIQSDTPGADYTDFFNKELSVREVRDTLRFGNFPEGLILTDAYDQHAIVVGGAGYPQRLHWLVTQIVPARTNAPLPLAQPPVQEQYR